MARPRRVKIAAILIILGSRAYVEMQNNITESANITGLNQMSFVNVNLADQIPEDVDEPMPTEEEENVMLIVDALDAILIEDSNTDVSDYVVDLGAAIAEL